MLISLEQLTLPASTTTRGAVANFVAKDADMLWDTERGIVWVKPRQFGQATRVFGLGPGVELQPVSTAFEQVYPQPQAQPKPKPQPKRSKDGSDEAQAS